MKSDAAIAPGEGTGCSTLPPKSISKKMFGASIPVAPRIESTIKPTTAPINPKMPKVSTVSHRIIRRMKLF